MISKAYADMAFVAGRKFILNGVEYAIGDPVDVTGVSLHRIRQMVASRHLRVADKVDLVDLVDMVEPVEPVEPVYPKTRSKRAA